MQPFLVTNHIAGLILNAAYVIWLVPEFIHTYTHRVDTKSTADDRRSGLGIALSIWVGIFLAYTLAHAEPQADIAWHSALLFTLGIILMVTGVIFRWYAVSVLGKYFSFQLAVQPGQTVVEQGPYRWIRHPLDPSPVLYGRADHHVWAWTCLHQLVESACHLDRRIHRIQLSHQR